MNYFHKNFLFLLAKNKIVLSQMAKEMDITRQAINEYKNGKYPNYNNLIKISNYLNINIDDLLKKDMTSNSN